jgi:hypothetical protein
VAIPGTSFVFDDTGSLAIWNYETGAKVASLETNSHYPRTYVVSSDGRWLATGDVSGNIFIWDLSPLTKPAGKADEAKTPPKKKVPPPIKLVKRTWSSSDGKFKVKALLEKIDGENVQLRKDDDSVASVPFARLSLADKKYVESVRPQLESPPTEASNPESTKPKVQPAEETPFVLTGPVEPPQPAPPVGRARDCRASTEARRGMGQKEPA